MIKNLVHIVTWFGFGTIIACLANTYVYAAEHMQADEHEGSELAIDSAVQVVEYPANFFQRYTPNTALDMILQIPGFQLDDGDTARGFGGVAGNVLINDRRPSTKQDLLSAFLGRIPASQVEAIEIIRGQVRDISLLGQPVVANVILSKDSPAAIRWDAIVDYNLDFGPTLESNVSLSDRTGQVDYNAGFSGRRFNRGDFTIQDVFDGKGKITEHRFDDNGVSGFTANANLNASSWLSDTFVRFNSRFGGEKRDELRISVRTPSVSGSMPRNELFEVDFDRQDIELGFDAERSLHTYLLGKFILLYISSEQDLISYQRSFDINNVQTRVRVADSGSLTTESIGRFEFDWTRLTNHIVQANLEVAVNVLDNFLQQTVDEGAGPVTVDILRGNSRIKESRGDFLLKDIWSLGQYDLDYGLGAEVSTIFQIGDVEQKHIFYYIKPHVVLTYSSGHGSQTRFRFAREVSQLDFNDFVSATVYEDDSLSLGNPDLRPEKTLILSFSHERRFGRSNVVKLTFFHHWISDVQDLLPLTPIFAVPGNIGDGRRWGVEMESTLSLEQMGLAGARLGFNARLQGSGVDDPVTNEKRPLSIRTIGGPYFPLAFRDESQYAFIISYRQDFELARISWGWDIRKRAERPFFKVNELDVYDDGTELNTFIETTRWYGLKLRLGANNIFNLVESRNRTVFIGERDLSAVNFRELRDRTRGFRLRLAVSGNF